MKQLENPYLLKFREATGKKKLDKWNMDVEINIYHRRRELIREYSFAVPCDEAIMELVKHSPLVELGAGTGYWASLVNLAGGRIRSYDRNLTDNEYKFHKSYHPVEHGTEEVLESEDSGTNLFLCWPCLNSDFAFRALTKFQGKILVYVGEGWGGCCGEEKFFSTLDTCWELVNEIDIPKWPYIHDRMYVYRRKKNEEMG